MSRTIFGQIGKLKPEKVQEYMELHANPWPEVLKTIQNCNLRNYSIFLHGTTVFSYFEYVGTDYEADMAKMDADPITLKWWTHTKPCFEKFSISPESEFYHDMKQIFYYDNGDDKMNYGKKVWIFPDAELPPVGTNEIPGHESIIITNVTDEKAEIKITLIYTDKEPKSLTVSVEPRRVRCLRTNSANDFGELTAAFDEQYAIMLESNVPVVAQYGRAEPRTVAFYTTPGYCE